MALAALDDAAGARFVFELLFEELGLLGAEVVLVFVDPDSFFEGDFGGIEETLLDFGVICEF
jgi:hypothetical protein